MLQVLLSNGSLFQLLILIPFPPGQMGNVAASCWRRSGLSEEKSARTRTRTYFVETKGYVLQTVAFPFLQTAQQASVCVFSFNFDKHNRGNRGLPHKGAKPRQDGPCILRSVNWGLTPVERRKPVGRPMHLTMPRSDWATFSFQKPQIQARPLWP